MEEAVQTATVSDNAAPDQLVGDEHIEWPISEEMEARLWQMHEAVMEHWPHHCEAFVAVPYIPVPGETYTPELKALLEALTVELEPWFKSLGSTHETPSVYFNLKGMTVMAHGWDFYLEPEQTCTISAGMQAFEGICYAFICDGHKLTPTMRRILTAAHADMRAAMLEAGATEALLARVEQIAAPKQAAA